jgi:hypothetical protein
MSRLNPARISVIVRRRSPIATWSRSTTASIACLTSADRDIPRAAAASSRAARSSGSSRRDRTSRATRPTVVHGTRGLTPRFCVATRFQTGIAADTAALWLVLGVISGAVAGIRGRATSAAAPVSPDARGTLVAPTASEGSSLLGTTRWVACSLRYAQSTSRASTMTRSGPRGLSLKNVLNGPR